MAHDNIRLVKPNMEFVDGYFFTMDETRKSLIQKSDDGSTVFEYPCQTTPLYLVYFDNFDTNTYNPDYWTYGGTNGGFRDGKFWSRRASGVSSGQTYLYSKFRAKGTYDIRIEYNLVALQAINYGGGQFNLRNMDSNPVTYVQVRRAYENSNHRYIAHVYDGTTWSTIGDVATTDTIGGMRFYRAYNSSTTTVYYKSGITGSWTSMGSTSTVGIGNSNNVMVRLYSTNGTGYPEVEFEFDNFYMSISLGSIISLQYDGTYFWTLQKILGSNEPVIRKWLVRNYVCEMADEFIIENTTGSLYDSDAFAVEHYITNLSTSASGGDITIHIDGYYDTVVTSGSVLSIGENGDSNLEDVTVSGVIGPDVILSSGLLYDHSAETKVITSPSFFLFNNYTGTSSTNGSLMRFDASSGSYLTLDSLNEYKNVTAATFSRFQNILRGYEDVSAVVFVKNTEARFRNMSDLLSLTDAYSANDDFTGADDSIPNTDLWSITQGNPRIFDNSLFCSTTIDGYDELTSNYLLTGDFDVQISGSSGSMDRRVFAIDFNDDFTYSGTGGIPNTDRWIRGGADPSLGYLDNNTLYLATLNAGAKDSNVRTTYLLRGDFDVQVDFQLVIYPATNTWATNLVARIGAAGDMIYISRRYESKHLFAMRTYGSSSTTIGTFDSTMTSGKLRLVRSGPTITGYYWSGSAWVSLGSSTFLGVNDVYIYLWQDMAGSNPTSATRFDNFIVNSVADITLYQHLDVPVYSDLNDDFTYSGTGGIPDITKWIVSRGAYLDNNTLYMHETSNSGDAAIRSTYYLSGNFDIQIDFELIIYPNILDWASELRITDVVTNNFVVIRKTYGGSTPHRFVLYDYVKITDTWTFKGYSISSLTSSKFRLVRNYGTITGYYWNGSAWTSVGTSTLLGTSDIFISLIEGSWTNSPDIAVRFDNFLVNSVDSILLDTDSYNYIDGQGTVVHGGLSDTFTYSGTGGVPDTDKWSASGNAYLDNNTLYVATIGSSGGSVRYLSSFIGDFDVQVDFQLVTYPSINSWATYVRVASNDSSDFFDIRRTYDSSTHRFILYDYVSSTNTYNYRGSANSTLTSSKLRVVRVGNTITGHYWNGSVWVSLGSSTLLGTSSIRLYLSQGSWGGNPSTVVRFNDFKINSVDEVDYCYYLHGIRLKFPYTSNYWYELTRRSSIDSFGDCITTRYNNGTTTSHLKVDTTTNDYMLRLSRVGSTIYSYYKPVTSGIVPSTWTSIGSMSFYYTDCTISPYLYSQNVTVSGSYFDNLEYTGGTIRYPSPTIPYYGIMNIDNIRVNGSTIIPVYDLSYANGTLYRLQDEGTYYGTDNDWGTQYNYVVSPVRSFIDAITIDAYPVILPADGRNITEINCVVLDQFSNGAMDKPITFTDNDDYGYVTINPKNTDNIFGTGQAITYYRAGVDVHTVTIQGTVTQYD